MLYGIVGSFLAWFASRTRKATSVTLLDRREFARLSDKARPHTRSRDADNVYAVVLHQMGFSRGNDPSRYDKVTAHYKIMPDGTIVFSHGWDVRLPHANKFNAGSVGIEFVGNLPSRYGSTDPKHYWEPGEMGMDQATPAQISAGRGLMRKLRGEGITHVLAHRQSSGERGNDPGPDIWYGVGQWAVDNLGLIDGGADYSIGSGKPIPDFWRTGPGQA